MIKHICVLWHAAIVTTFLPVERRVKRGFRCSEVISISFKLEINIQIPVCAHWVRYYYAMQIIAMALK